MDCIAPARRGWADGTVLWCGPLNINPYFLPKNRSGRGRLNSNIVLHGSIAVYSKSRLVSSG